MVSKYHITLNREDIEQVDNIKLLDVCINCKPGIIMFNSSEKNISKALGISYKAKTWAKHHTMLTL